MPVYYGAPVVPQCVVGSPGCRRHGDRVETMRNRAGVIVVKDGSVALIERHREGRRYWVVPGGGVEPGETVADAARREGQEELGVPITLGPLLVELLARYADGSPGQHFYYQASVASAAISVVGPETDNPASSGTYEAVWVRLDDMPSLDVRPPEIAELIVAHGDGTWPAGLSVDSPNPF